MVHSRSFGHGLGAIVAAAGAAYKPPDGTKVWFARSKSRTGPEGGAVEASTKKHAEKHQETEISMTRWFVCAAIAMAASGYGAAPASAQYAPWCAQFQNRGYVRECSFHSFAACEATVRGVGGFCLQNPAFGYAPRRDRRY
jgi:uncharacterized protein DUF3551